MNWNVIFNEEIDSTNLEVRRLSQKGESQGLVVMAERQTDGRGRRGRTWESPAEGNLYFSILLCPEFVPSKAPMLTILMAYTVALVLKRKFCEDNIPVQIKWPNDIIISEKKICGILTEMNLEGSQIEDVIIGVGINVNTTNFPEELQDKATSLKLESGKEVSRDSLLQEILQEFEYQYEDFRQIQNLSRIQEAYNHMLVNANREVLVLEPGKEYRAQALGINKVGELIVEKEDGSVETVFAGEVSVRGVCGYA